MTTPPTEPRRPLLAARSAALAVSLVCFGLIAVLALRLHGTRDPTGFDQAVDRWLYDNTGSVVARFLLVLSEPPLTIGIVIVITVVAALLRRPDIAAVGAIGPVLALALESEVLKPWIDRRFGIAETLTNGLIKAGYAFPSGHETGLASAATLLGIVAVRGRSRAVRGGIVAALAVWAVLGAAGLVRNSYHYASDTVGGVLLGLGVVLMTAVAVDLVMDRTGHRTDDRADDRTADGTGDRTADRTADRTGDRRRGRRSRRVSSPGAHARSRTARGA